MHIKLSAKVFAEFLVGGTVKKTSTVRKLLKPKAPEVQIPAGYYNPAIAIIRSYHDQNNDAAYLKNELKQLATDIEVAATPQARTKKDRNLLAVHSYMSAFSEKKWKVVPCPRIYYSASDVRISGKPDLAVKDGSRFRLIKLGVRKEKETVEMVRVMLRVIYQAASSKLEIEAKDITYFDVKTGTAISGKQSDSTLAGAIDEGCAELQLLASSH